MQIPVYIFTGFLEAGKTRFIQETLEDKRFNAGERTLLLLCEEGEEEYDPERFASSHVYVKSVDGPEQLTEQNLTDWLKENRCKRVIVEYNGMWLLAALFQNMPQNWVIHQEFMFADANTFQVYNNNMRELVVDKLNTCELVVFNRYTPAVDKMALHKIVRATSRRADIAYESPDENVEYDDIEDPLPFDINAPIIEIADADYALWYRDMGENMDAYDGKTVTLKVQAVHEEKLSQNGFIVGRDVMTCCADDIMYAGLVVYPQNVVEFKNRDWLEITAVIRLEEHPLYGRRGPVLQLQSAAKTTPPTQEVATFY